MSHIVPVLFSARWYPPVNIVEKTRVRQIRGPAEAVRYMRDNFTVARPACSRAISVCYAALRLETDHDTAKMFFLAAYENEIHVSKCH
ncbi:DUF982 domain-containing protein [Rhizobium sp. NTR19]|uniref:DUF982 domain-containing protein n=1 Tax=Neorhizobium turbinariae TaxID=2937795 RepID=A0ABT0IMI5_9HYPH|nr:DUF982 domain-containing protein [Neorhizobium turbinariae]MCK8779068.1 DUF982 domain-containing protein [Neorhizobium turbinariae]